MVHERIAKLKQQFPEGTFLENEPMSAHTSFRIGGPADLFAEPSSADELAEFIAAAENAGVPYLVLGNGSNVLVKDGGIDGLVIHIGPKMARIDIRPFPTGFDDGWYTLTAEAGALLSEISMAALEAGPIIGDETKGLTGLEFASGIPGSLGGGLFMNAGAYGGQMSDVLTRTVYWDGEKKERKTEDGGFGYRSSPFFGTDALVLGAEIRLRRGERGEIEAKMAELAAQRREKQPLNFPSAGSAFKRPQGHFAGKLIEDCGLKGYAVGGAQVSEKHAGFVINRGGATCADVLRLLEHIEKTVYDRFGVRLEREIQVIE